MEYFGLLVAGLKRIRYYILVNAVAFIVGIIVGTLMWQDLAEQVMNEFEDIGNLLSMGPLEIFLYILQHNMFIAYPLSYALGITVIVPVLVMLVNGAGVSALVIYFEETTGIPVVFSVAAMLPHGVLEVPAIILAASAGVDFGVSTWMKVFKKIDLNEYKRRLKEELAIIVLTIILLIAAAGIETGLIIMSTSLVNTHT